MTLWTRIKSWFCGHHFHMGVGSWRDENHMLHSVCLKCGREYVASCGIELPYKQLIFSHTLQDTKERRTL